MTVASKIAKPYKEGNHIHWSEFWEVSIKTNSWQRKDVLPHATFIITSMSKHEKTSSYFSREVQWTKCHWYYTMRVCSLFCVLLVFNGLLRCHCQLFSRWMFSVSKLKRPWKLSQSNSLTGSNRLSTVSPKRRRKKKEKLMKWKWVWQRNQCDRSPQNVTHRLQSKQSGLNAKPTAILPTCDISVYKINHMKPIILSKCVQITKS